MLSNKTPLRHRYAMPPLPKERLSCILRTIQNLQSYELCGILDIEKDNRPQRWVAKLVKKNPLRTRQSQGAVFLCP